MLQEQWVVENEPVPGGVDPSRVATFGRMMTMFKWIVILAVIILTGLFLFTR